MLTFRESVDRRRWQTEKQLSPSRWSQTWLEKHQYIDEILGGRVRRCTQVVSHEKYFDLENGLKGCHWTSNREIIKKELLKESDEEADFKK